MAATTVRGTIVFLALFLGYLGLTSMESPNIIINSQNPKVLNSNYDLELDIPDKVSCTNIIILVI
jgi:hypothetical protein